VYRLTSQTSLRAPKKIRELDSDGDEEGFPPSSFKVNVLACRDSTNTVGGHLGDIHHASRATCFLTGLCSDDLDGHTSEKGRTAHEREPSGVKVKTHRRNTDTVNPSHGTAISECSFATCTISSTETTIQSTTRCQCITADLVGFDLAIL